jgi:hypothetical protein
MKRRSLLLGLLTLLACTNGDPTLIACTEIGCDSGIRVRFDQAPPPETIVTMTVTGSAPRVVRCGIDAPCDDGVWFSGLTPDRVVVTVSTPEGEWEQEMRPDYEEFQPNGPDCPPTCIVAELMAELPSGG